MLNWPINKTKKNITNTVCSSPELCCCSTAGLKTFLAKFINRNKQTANSQRARTPVFLVYFFTKSEGKQQVCYLKTSATGFYNNTYKKFLVQRCDVFRLILHSWRLRFLLQWASACVPRSESHSRLNFQMKPLLRWTVFWFAFRRLLVNKTAPCFIYSGQQLAEGFNSAIHISSVNKANPEKIWTTIWIFCISMTHIKAYFPTIRP